MARKIHLRANKLTGANRAKAVCASYRTPDGRCRSNNRGTYRFMASEIVSFKDFITLPSSDRCSHCVDNGLVIRNRIRKERGFTQVACIDAAFTEKEG